MGICRGWRSPLFFSVLPLVLFLPLILSVIRSHKFRREVAPNKSDHLVLGPAAGQGLPDRLQCQGLSAVNKIHASSSQQNLQTRDDISFATVYTIYNNSIRSVLLGYVMVTVANSTYSKAERSIGILNVLVDFLQVSIPRSSIIVLTDPASDFTINRSNTTILPILGDYSQGNLLLQRISSYIAFIEGRLQEHSKGLRIYSHYIFTDSDITVVVDLGNIFHKYPDFHLILTFRNNKYQPLNSGFIAVRGTADGIYTSVHYLPFHDCELLV